MSGNRLISSGFIEIREKLLDKVERRANPKNQRELNKIINLYVKNYKSSYSFGSVAVRHERDELA